MKKIKESFIIGFALLSLVAGVFLFVDRGLPITTTSGASGNAQFCHGELSGSLSTAKNTFQRNCPQARARDCDRLSAYGNRWVCADTRSIPGNFAPGGGATSQGSAQAETTTAQPQPAATTHNSQQQNATNSQGLCHGEMSNSLSTAQDTFKRNCPQARARDCDRLSAYGNLWICADTRSIPGNFAPGGGTTSQGSAQAETNNRQPSSGDCVDPDGDGWGWNGKESCVMDGATHNTPTHNNATANTNTGSTQPPSQLCHGELSDSISIAQDTFKRNCSQARARDCDRLSAYGNQWVCADTRSIPGNFVPSGGATSQGSDEPQIGAALGGAQQKQVSLGGNISQHTTGGARVIQNGQDGSMRVNCLMSHFSYDDSIVYPGRKGQAHLHMFFGNTQTDHNSTYNSLISRGGGTCQGGPLNRSAYWIPALIDRDNNARIPQYGLVYYKSGNLHGKNIREFPKGLKMIAGNAGANSTGQNNAQYEWYCGWPQSGMQKNRGKTIPNCAPGEWISLKLVFPQCWNGRDLDSKDHRSHMRYPSGRNCPSSHPIPLPEVTYNLYWNNNDQDTNGWYISSDRHHGRNVPGGTTTHGDWIGAWHPDVLTTFVQECNNRDHDCIGGSISPSVKLDMSSASSGVSARDFHNRNLPPQKIPVQSIRR